MVWYTGLPVSFKYADTFNSTLYPESYQKYSVETRHACDQGDNLDGYTWTEYDVREGGVQVLKDGFNNVKITTEFLKVPGGDYGGSWAARVKGEPIDKGLYMLCTDVAQR